MADVLEKKELFNLIARALRMSESAREVRLERAGSELDARAWEGLADAANYVHAMLLRQEGYSDGPPVSAGVEMTEPGGSITYAR